MARHSSSPLRLQLDRATAATAPAPGDPEHRAYMGADAGPFRCDHCDWYGPADRCNEPHIIEDSTRRAYGLRFDGRRAIVDAGGCSDYFEPKRERST